MNVIIASPDADYIASLRVAYDLKGDMYIHGGFQRQMEYPNSEDTSWDASPPSATPNTASNSRQTM